MMSQQLMRSYWGDQCAIASASAALYDRVAAGFSGSPWHPALRTLAREYAEDHETLRAALGPLDLGDHPVRRTLGVATERVGRLKPNGSLLRRTPLTGVVELEGLRVAVAARITSLQTLRALTLHDERVGAAIFERLLDRAQDQADRLYRLHLQVVQSVVA